SEVVGMLPKKALIDAGKYFLEKQERSTGISEEEIIHIAVKSMGLDELGPFDPKKKIIEYCMQDEGANPLIGMTLTKFAEETASESVAPGGGSVSAYVGALGISLGTMVANLSAHKRGWDARWHEFSMWADRGQDIKDRLLALVDEDTRSFNAIITAMRMPKSNDTEKKIRSAAIQEATKYAIQVPFAVMKTSMEAYGVIEEMVREGNPSSVTDGAVGALCVNTAVQGAWMNALVNMSGLKDEEFKKNILEEGKKMAEKSTELSKEIANIVLQKL
ncbi:MAG TPA: cyclodeaminase/cyclohydrolase family protein, partial [Saprospiraceae bacterium]|nr:cyclodeaminase/cyclohydrolase family protein [Saprospiraceae bacterium]